MILLLLIDEKEGGDISIADMVGVYLLTDMKDYVIVKLSEKKSEVICEVNTKYNGIIIY